MKAIIAIMCATLLSACTSGHSDTAPKVLDLNKTSWVFEANNLIDAWIEPVGSAPLTLEFNDGHVSGFAGCNSFFGAYTQVSD